MLSQVLVTNSQGDLLVMSLDQVSDEIIIESIEGLDPVKATLVSSGFATLDGAQYQTSRRETRNLIFHLGLEPNYAEGRVKDVRDRLYKFFMPKMKVQCLFLDDSTLTGTDTHDIEGIVESCETPLFVAEPAVDISIMCYDPDFIAHDETSVVGSTSSVTTDSLEIEYTGTVESGFLFALSIDRVLNELTIKNTAPDGSFQQADFAYPFVADDVLYVNSTRGEKSVEVLRAGVRTPILYAMSRQSNWMELQRGSNFFSAYATGASIPYEITYHNRLGGL